MAKLDLTYDLVNYTPASATPVEVNFNHTEQHINQELIERDGSVAMRAQLKLIGDPVAPLDAAPRQYVDAVLPVGIIMMYGGVTAPLGGRWALCNGAEVETVTYPELYNVLSSRYSPAGTPAGRFNLPNLLDRFPIGAGTTAALGATGGNKDSVVPTHNHSIDHTHAAGTSGTDSTGHSHTFSDTSDTVSANHNHYLNFGKVYRQTGSPINNVTVFGMTIGQGIMLNVEEFQTSNANATGIENQNHTHNVGGTTSVASPDHSHSVPATSMTGSSGTTGVAVANTNLPPYLGITYIIRIS